MTKQKNAHIGDMSPEKIAERIKVLLSDSLSGSEREAMQKWLWDPENKDGKLDALADLLVSEILAAGDRDSDDVVTEEETRRFDRIQEKIGRNEKNAAALTPRKNKSKLSRGLSLGRIAAVLLPFIFVAGGVLLWKRSNDKDTVAARTEITYAVPEGIQKDIKLADNSTVWINSGGTLTAPEEFTDIREVELEGEAFFKVEKDAKRPFIVRTRHLQVKVLGTEFSVTAHAGDDTTEVALHTGSVEVTAGGHSKVMKPGERLVYVYSQNRMYVDEPEGLTDWRSTKVYVRNKTLDELFSMLASYYDIEVIRNDAFSDDETYSVTFGKHIPASEVVKILSLTSGRFIYVEKEDKILIDKL